MALVLMITLLSGLYAFYKTSLEAREAGSQYARDAMLMRSLLTRMAAEVRHAASIVPGDGIGFQGVEDRIIIVRTRMPGRQTYNRFDSPHDELPPAEMDLERITYQLLWDEENEDEQGDPLCHGLWRQVQTTFDPNPSFVVKTSDDPTEAQEDQPGAVGPKIDGELVAPEVKYLRFEYFDGAEWRDRWHVPYEAEEETAEGPEEGEGGDGGEGGGGGFGTPSGEEKGTYALPQAVRITLGQVPDIDEVEARKSLSLSKLDKKEKELEEPHEDRFAIVVAVPTADPSLLNSRQHGVKNELQLQTGGGS